MGQDGRESMRGGRREKGSETSISRRRRAAVKAPSRGKCRTQSQQQQLEGGGGSGIPMPQLLHTGRRRGHLNEVLTDIQARSEAELPKKKKKHTATTTTERKSWQCQAAIFNFKWQVEEGCVEGGLRGGGGGGYLRRAVGG